MSPRSQFLLVAPTAAVSDAVVEWLTSTDCVLTVVADFESARRLLNGRFDLLITEVKLAAFNGLHLAIRAQSHGIPSLVIGEGERFFQAEAHNIGVAYLTTPLIRENLLAVVQQIIDGPVPRRSARKRVPAIEAFADDARVRIVDVSYDGMQLELADAAAAAFPSSFVVRLPSYNVTCQATRVWTAQPPDSGQLRCGVAVAATDAGEAAMWRAFVDAAPSAEPAFN